MLTENEIEEKYTDDDYNEHIEYLNNSEDAKERLSVFLDVNLTSLKQMYCRAIMDSKITILEKHRSDILYESFTDWVADIFIIWDCNNKLDSKLTSEINDLIEGK